MNLYVTKLVCEKIKHDKHKTLYMLAFISFMKNKDICMFSIAFDCFIILKIKSYSYT